MKKVGLSLDDRSYDVWVGSGLLPRLPRLLMKLSEGSARRAFLIYDSRLPRIVRSVSRVLRRQGWSVELIAVKAGERLKDIKSVFPLYGELLRRKADRNSILIAVGGGSVGDAAGFVASTYMRGISWVGIPTTLLAQVDSAVGGKTAINHEAGKNLIGTTHQPRLVVCDTDFLGTLSKREIVSGLGEAVKYGIIYDPKFFLFFEKSHASLIKRQPAGLVHAIERSVYWKCKVVAQDEFDRKGVREALNFGHTFGHALEAATQFKRYQHGEAVIWGMRFACALSRVRGTLSSKEYLRIDDLLRLLPVPKLPKRLSPEKIFSLMKKDKKIQSGQVRFVLLSKIGKTYSDRGVAQANLLAAYFLMLGGGR